MASDMPVLRLSSISKRFGGLTVLSGLELDVGDNEVLGILGPNGAGKSTLFSIIAGVLAASSGRVIYKGRDVTRLPAWTRCRAGIARTYQIPKPFGHMSVFENVLVAGVHGAGLRVSEARHRTHDVLERAGLSRLGRELAGSLRLLDLKRLELARALACGPQLLLLDEIAGGLTEAECDVLVDLILSIKAEGKTIVWVEHVMEALRRGCSRLAVIHGGAVLADGPPAQVLARPDVKAIYLGEGGET
jgi:branched-chain amino acid transport system ATP-binding protein